MRMGARVTRVETDFGTALPEAAMLEAIARVGPRVVAFVHAETSTGVCQPVEALARAARDAGALVLLDCVTSLGGLPLRLESWGVDAAYSGTQKCLSCPPGLSPASFSERAVERVRTRETPVQSWYLDLSLISSYWGAERAYHHTAPINMLYGLHEALRLVLQEGLAARTARHDLHSKALVAGLGALGLEARVPEAERLSPLTAVAVPEGVEDAAVRRFLLERFSLEIGGGLGPMQGNTWRIGLMGSGATRSNVSLCLAGLGAALRDQGYKPPGDALAAAAAVYG